MSAKTLLPAMLFCFLCFTNMGYGQQLEEQRTQSSQEQYEFHIKKKRTNLIAGWATLGSGIAMVIGGIGWNMSTGFDGDTTNNRDGLWLSYLGGATTLVSIPLFVASGKHKKKAKVHLKNGATGFNSVIYSGIALTINF